MLGQKVHIYEQAILLAYGFVLPSLVEILTLQEALNEETYERRFSETEYDPTPFSEALHTFTSMYQGHHDLFLKYSSGFLQSLDLFGN